MKPHPRGAAQRPGGLTLRGAGLAAVSLFTLVSLAARADAPRPSPSAPAPGAAAPSPAAPSPAAPAPSPAAPASGATRARKIPLAITVSGGVSLGAYEAGYLYYLAEFLVKNPDLFDLRIATGASAGSLNALLALLATCSRKSERARDSLFYRTWAGIGIDELYVPGDVGSLGLFSRRAFAKPIGEVEAAFRAGLPASCDVVLGIPATRVSPEELAIEGGSLSLPRTQMRFVVRLRGGGVGKVPRLDNYVDPAYPLEQPLLPTSGSGKGAFWPLRDLLYASGAFPLAFAPVPLRHCLREPRRWEDGSKALEAAQCTPEEAGTEAFLDGGVFDNQPLGLAVRVLQGGLVERGDGGAAWRDVPGRPLPDMPRDMVFLYLDPGLVGYPAPVGDAAPRSAQELLLGFAASFVRTARAKELISIFEERPELRDAVSVAEAPLPAASAPLGAFFGFFERSFRDHDFWLGVYAGRLHMDRIATRLERGGTPRSTPTFPEDDASRRESYRPLSCMRSVMTDPGRAAEACRGDDLEDYRILLQVSLDRLFSHCRALGARARSASHALCRRAGSGALPPRVPFVRALAGDAHLRGTSESELDHVLRLLEHYHFRFADLGLERGDAGEAGARIHDKLTRMTASFQDVQGSGGALVGALLQPLIDSVAYGPSRHIVHAVVGPQIEVGYSVTDPTAGWRFLRPSASLAFSGYSSLLAAEYKYVTLTPHLGFEIEPTGFNDSAFQVRLGVRGGFQLSTADAFGAGDCDPEGPAPCSRPAGQIYGALSLFGKLRVQLATEVLFPMRARERVTWAILPAAGVQLGWP